MIYRILHGAAISFLLFFLLEPVPPLFSADTFHPDASIQELMRRGDYQKAIEQLRKDFNLFPYDQSIRKSLAMAYAGEGRRQLELKQFDAAAENFDNARQLIPGNRDFRIFRGIALYLGKRYDEAAVELEQARQEGGDSAPLLYYLGRVYYDTGDLGPALEAWDRALALEPGNVAISEMVVKARRESAVESRMEKGYGSMFALSYAEGTKSDLADAVLDVLADAYNKVGSDFSYYPAARIPVILYAKKDFRSVTGGPEWSAGLYDGKVRLPVGGASEITPMLRGVLFHEYTHVVVGELTRGNCPAWLNEGLAEVEGRTQFSLPTNALEEAVRTGDLLPFSLMENSMSSLDVKHAALAYQQCYSMVSFMISSYGLHKVRDVLVNLGNGMRIETAITGAFADYGLDYEGIVHEWRDYLRKQYGSN
jgi:tetratricopeptide (TPR) repeat protein